MEKVKGMNSNLQFCCRAVLTISYCHNLVQKKIAKLPLEHYYIDNIMMIREKKEVINMLQNLVRSIHFRKWEISPINMQGSATLIKFSGSGSQGFVAAEDVKCSKVSLTLEVYASKPLTARP